MRIILCGFGVVGQSFAKLLISRSDDLYARYGLKPRIVGICDRNGSAVDASGLDINRLIQIKKQYNSVKKYSLMTILFVCGLLFVSVLKNETRNLQKEINKLEAAINVIKFNLKQAILDNEVITSPENISRLAKEYLNINLTSYKRSQIKNLNDKTEEFTKVSKIKKKETSWARVPTKGS